MYRYKNKIYLLQNKIWWIFIFSFSEDSFWFVSKSLCETEKWKSVYLVIGATLKLFFTKKYLSYPKKKLLIFFYFWSWKSERERMFRRFFVTFEMKKIQNKKIFKIKRYSKWQKFQNDKKFKMKNFKMTKISKWQKFATKISKWKKFTKKIQKEKNFKMTKMTKIQKKISKWQKIQNKKNFKVTKISKWQKFAWFILLFFFKVWINS